MSTISSNAYKHVNFAYKHKCFMHMELTYKHLSGSCASFVQTPKCFKKLHWIMHSSSKVITKMQKCKNVGILGFVNRYFKSNTFRSDGNHKQNSMSTILKLSFVIPILVNYTYKNGLQLYLSDI